MKRPYRNRTGQTVVLFTLAIVPLLGLVGLVVDVGYAYFRKEAAQTAADAAAEAAALAAYHFANGAPLTCAVAKVACYADEYTCPAALPAPPAAPSDNIQAGCMYARDNGFATAGKRKLTFQSGVGAAPIASGVTISYWTVARASEEIPQLFSAVLGHPTMTVVARAATGARDGTSGGCVVSLDPTAPNAIGMTGTTSLTTGCGVFVNSNSSQAISLSGGGTITTTGNAKTEIVGNCSGCGNIHPAPLTGVPSSGDPFADMIPPTVPRTCDSGSLSFGSHESKTINPGVYCGGINLSAQSSLKLNPGLYILKGGISMGGQTTITGSGVTIYLQSGGVSMAGGASINLSAPSSGDWQGILFYQDRANTSTVTLVGGTNQAMNGVLYFPSSHLTYTGGSDTTATATTIVSKTLSLVGNSYISSASTTKYTGNAGGVVLIE